MVQTIDSFIFVKRIILYRIVWLQCDSANAWKSNNCVNEYYFRYRNLPPAACWTARSLQSSTGTVVFCCNLYPKKHFRTELLPGTFCSAPSDFALFWGECVRCFYLEPHARRLNSQLYFANFPDSEEAFTLFWNYWSIDEHYSKNLLGKDCNTWFGSKSFKLAIRIHDVIISGELNSFYGNASCPAKFRSTPIFTFTFYIFLHLASELELLTIRIALTTVIVLSLTFKLLRLLSPPICMLFSFMHTP